MVPVVPSPNNMEIPDMSDSDNESIATLLREMRTFHQQISLLLLQADKLMKDNGWQAERSVAKSGSNSVEQPERWMPGLIFRYYRSERHKRLLGFISVILLHPDHDDPLHKPLISAGWYEYDNAAKEWWPDFGALHVWAGEENDLDSGALAVLDLVADGWSERDRQGAVKAVSFALPLLAIRNTQDLKEKIVDRLLEEIAKEAVD